MDEKKLEKIITQAVKEVVGIKIPKKDVEELRNILSNLDGWYVRHKNDLPFLYDLYETDVRELLRRHYEGIKEDMWDD